MNHETVLQFAIEKGAAGPAAPPNFSGHWINQMQSTMELAVAGSNVTGIYTSSSSGGGGPVAGVLKGNVSGDMISFLVLWPGGSMTAWVGQLVDEQTAPRIKTLWHLVTNIDDPAEPDKLWMSTFAGADEFHR